MIKKNCSYLNMYISNFLITSVAVNPLTLNTLTTKSDRHQISPHNITLESHVKVMRIKEMNTNKRRF